MSTQHETFNTGIWIEEPESDNSFAAAVCLCHGYYVYGEMLGRASWIEYLQLLFLCELPTAPQVKLLVGPAVALANPCIRDHSVNAAMIGGVGGSTAASCLMAALAVGAGQLGGAHDVFRAMEYWAVCGTDLEKWKSIVTTPPQEERADIWLPMEHVPGFDPHGASCTTLVRQTLSYLSGVSQGTSITWLQHNRINLETIADAPLAMSGVAAAALMDLGLSPDQGEMLYLLLRLPGAAVHALEQKEYGWRRFPFFTHALELENDPGEKSSMVKEETSTK